MFPYLINLGSPEKAPSVLLRGCVIYFLEARNQSVAERGLARPIKIGYTESFETLEARIGALQIGNPHELELLAVCPGTEEDEKSLHHKFRDRHIRGEWFRSNSALRKVIEGAKAADWH